MENDQRFLTQGCKLSSDLRHCWRLTYSLEKKPWGRDSISEVKNEKENSGYLLSDKADVAVLGCFPQSWVRGLSCQPPERALREVLIINFSFSRGRDILICQKLVFDFYFCLYKTWFQMSLEREKTYHVEIKGCSLSFSLI